MAHPKADNLGGKGDVGLPLKSGSVDATLLLKRPG